MSKIKTDLSPLWYWINERHRIWLRRNANFLRKDWTSDPIFMKYRFCNVFRELDKVTIWLRENWREPYADHPNLWFAMCVARQTNHIPTFEALGFPDGDLVKYVGRARDILRKMRRNKEKIYGSAYIITAGGRSCEKYIYSCDYVLKPIAKRPPGIFGATPGSNPVPLQKMWSALRKFEGFGPFIAYEVVSDLRHTDYYDGSDHMSWANTGPGARRGINRLYYGSKHGQGERDEFYLQAMRDLLFESKQCLGKHVPKLEMRDIEHSLCETDKYLRAKLGEGSPKERFRAQP